MFKTLSLSAALLCGAACAQPKWMKFEMPNRLNDMPFMTSFSFAAAPDNPQDGSPLYVTVYSGGKASEGWAILHVHKFRRDYKTVSITCLRLDSLLFFPADTDSIRFLDKVGLPADSGWLFPKNTGEIRLYAPGPFGKASHVSFADGPIHPLGLSELEHNLASVPIAYVFAAIDADYAVRLYNEYRESDKRDPAGKVSLPELKKMVLKGTVHSWDMKMAARSSPEGSLETLIRAKYACQEERFDEGKAMLEDLRKRFPDVYLVPAFLGSCLESQGFSEAALQSYRLARMRAPDDSKTIVRLTESVDKLEGILAEKARRGPPLKPD
jgi:hypothetical protein